ncbi:Predicted arabinose efflux permease, MFS family [Actinopolymorpha cephalotaxi]|uniref:Predicted arabinose efflux permease, MFS family n=1 Tax=Actinopolymorpha cephalotaxi TaxID=504797 RepID=A0A1I2XET3_9ACTN|nr:MFS transporter [Actinopolymorpha cephalotaxi]NYH86224.1 hypothetical protein [Actinopolymorpha cephalotaxi]SFH12044.1 Predicted arabinose efflux permease, MFS family [Actinopolymorpha cephalotaxi]
MFAPYRGLLRLPGALRFSASGLLARLPISMVSLGLVILVSAKTGSYGLAGVVSAVFVVCRAVCSPMQARLVDRHGQHRTLPAIAGLNAAALGGLVVAVEVDAPLVVPVVLAGVAGAVSPSIGSYVRARWSHLLGRGPKLQTAFALEAVADELLFMVGPPVVTFLATGISPNAGLLVALACGLVGTLLLAALRDTEPPAHGRGGSGTAAAPMGWPALFPVVGASVGIGTLFGAFDISVIALATQADARAWSGVLLGITATGSMLSAAVLGSRTLRKPPLTRFRIGAAAITVAMLPLPFVSHLGLLAPIVFFTGLTISPTMIASVARVEETVPVSRLSEGIAWSTSALVGGIALGSAIAGRVIDGHGASAGFFVSLSAGVVATAVAWSGTRRGTGTPPVGAPGAGAPAGG